MRKIYEKDSRAVTKFIFWLKKNLGKIDITEVSAADYLESLRREIPEFIELSFPTISAYGENAAMMHYEANPLKPILLKSEGMYLVDSGGQYFGGTTDVTRTISLGPVTKEMKKHFTLTLVGMLQLSNAVFLEGCTGRSLDILARKALWEEGIDYKCGTGHGVGYCLNVHEGPQGIRFKYPLGYQEAPLEAGMVVTNEPGVYVKDSHGIRIENVLVVEKKIQNLDGLFYYFETLTMVPIDLELLDFDYMSQKDRVLLNAYHKKVYNIHESYLSEEEKIWLKEVTKEI
jgi:Xaa-Pro aminopeptidase